MANGSVGYTTKHVQVAPLEETPVWIDVPGSNSWEPSVNTPSENIPGDGGIYAIAYGNPEGTGDIVLVDMNNSVLATVNDGEVSSYGTAPDTVDRYEQKVPYIPVAFSIADFVPNVDKVHNPTVAGLRTIVPNATAEMARKSSGQNSAVNWTITTHFFQDENDTIIIYEWLATDPVFTAGVMPVNLTAPPVTP